MIAEMFVVGPGFAFVAGSLTLLVFAFAAWRIPVGRPPVRTSAGAVWAMCTGAAALAVVGGGVEWRSADLVAREAGGEELVSVGGPSGWWWLAVPALALGMAILSVALRQVMRKQIRGAAGWVGLALLGAVFFVQEGASRVWVTSGDHRVHVRSGVLFERTEVFSASNVTEVHISSRYYRGAQMYGVRLAGPVLDERLAALGADFRDAHAARLEAARWGSAGGWVVRETADAAD